MTEEHRQTLAAACPVHPDNPRIQQVSVLYAAQAPRLLRPGPVLKAATRLAWTGTACGLLGVLAIWTGNLIGGGAGGPAPIPGPACLPSPPAFFRRAAPPAAPP